tara:strand:+ start:19294 stop:19731 length:438 start_codon:yes stop_codon:yes gene_type:complete
MKINIGNKVKVHYVGKLTDGTEFDNSKQREKPLEFIIGEGKMLTSFENTVRGMSVGETKTVNIEYSLAYGNVKPEAVVKVPREDFPKEFRFVIDEVIQGKTTKGVATKARILEVTTDKVTLDMNHPLAGKDLNFEIELLEIENSI